MSKSFAEKLSESLGKESNKEFVAAYDALREIAEGIRNAVRGTSTSLEVELEPGFATNLGQQIRVTLRIPARNWRETLLRAYIPATGFPVSLDLYGEEPVRCDDKPALEREVLAFLGKPEIDNRLRIVRESM